MTLDNLRLLLDGPSDPPNFRYLKTSLKGCESTLHKLAAKLQLSLSVDSDKVKVGLRKRLIWPWKENEVGKLLAAIEKHKTIFILALAGDALRVTRAIEDGVSGVTQSIQTIAINQQNEQILSWIKSTDPSTNHAATRKKHEAIKAIQESGHFSRLFRELYGLRRALVFWMLRNGYCCRGPRSQERMGRIGDVIRCLPQRMRDMRQWFDYF